MGQTIKLNVRLSAYTKGALPDLSQYLTDAQGSIDKDDKVYARKNGEWVDIKTLDSDEQFIIAQPGSGLDLIQDEVELNNYYISIRQKTGKLSDIQHFEDDTTYYILDEQPEEYINGGTAFSDGNNDFIDSSEYQYNINGGQAHAIFELELLPINSKGVYDGN